MRISDWSSDVCSPDLMRASGHRLGETSGEFQCGREIGAVVGVAGSQPDSLREKLRCCGALAGARGRQPPDVPGRCEVRLLPNDLRQDGFRLNELTGPAGLRRAGEELPGRCYAASVWLVEIGRAPV